MQSELYDILTKLAAIQSSRQHNWQNGQPASGTLEAAHQLEITGLRKRLEAFSPTGQVAGDEDTHSQPETNSYRGGILGWLGNIFKTTKSTQP
jgi:hypothetical protein